MKSLAILILSISLLATSSFADSPNANLGSIMADAATNQMIKMFPLFIFALGIAIFFSLVQRNPQKAILGCGGFFAFAIILGIVTWFLDFIANHAFLFIILAITLFVIVLIIYMIYSPPTAEKKPIKKDSLEKEDPFNEGPY